MQQSRVQKLVTHPQIKKIKNSKRCFSPTNNSCDNESNSEEIKVDDSTTQESATTPQEVTRKQYSVKARQKDRSKMISEKIISQAGKSTSKYKDCCNFQKDTNGSIGWL